MRQAPVGDYVHRREEKKILEQAQLVRENGRSRAVLLYGVGGVGKTRMVRALATRDRLDERTRWIPAIDIDDSEFWLLESLQRTIATTLDPGNRFFGKFTNYLTRLPGYATPRIGKATVTSHHRRLQELFAECYAQYVTTLGSTIVVTLDTVEAMRSTYFLHSLTQWMKALPHTLFVLSGRPDTVGESQDPIRRQLTEPPDALPTVEVSMGGFGDAEALEFLDSSVLGDSLGPEQKSRLISLTAGHPLWLSLAVDYLQHTDPPAEMTAPELSGDRLREAFRRRLITPYRSTEFWAEAIKRLSVVRHSVDERVWRILMDDRELPPEIADWSQAWNELRARPWIRPRANNRYVTLHDALAEELSQRLIPLHDQDETWRHLLWKKAADAYEGLANEEYPQVTRELTEAFEPFAVADEALYLRVTRLDSRRRELDQLRAAGLFYRLLCDFEAGTEQFVSDFADTSDRHFQELACHELERFLPPGTQAPPLEDAIGVVIERFRAWLGGEPRRYLEIGIDVAQFLTQNAQPRAALALLDRLPEHAAETDVRYQLANERGNAWMGIPGQVEQARAHFDRALDRAAELASPEQEHRRAQAYKELGYYLRNLGRWPEADDHYRDAYQVIAAIVGPGRPAGDREELASIQANWGYLKALQGHYDDARNLVETALSVRKQLGSEHPIAVSLSVAAEVYRYERKFTRAWDFYKQAESSFVSMRNWPWLALIHQEQAICLFQAYEEGLELVENPVEQAKRLIRGAVDLCREQAVRYYPSALNRAGRIFGHDNPDLGLRYLEQSIIEARRVADGWFLSAGLIEYLELTYRAWTDSGDDRYVEMIAERVEDVEQAIEDYEFADLEARWELLQGHLLVRQVLAGDSMGQLDEAVEHYSRGFLGLAGQRVGSHGSAAIADEFARFHDLFARLSPDVQSQWYVRLRQEWTEPPSGTPSTSLLARLEQLY